MLPSRTAGPGSDRTRRRRRDGRRDQTVWSNQKIHLTGGTPETIVFVPRCDILFLSRNVRRAHPPRVGSTRPCARFLQGKHFMKLVQERSTAVDLLLQPGLPRKRGPGNLSGLANFTKAPLLSVPQTVPCRGRQRRGPLERD